MNLQLWRNATLQIRIQGTNLLIDPMLGKKGSFGIFPWTNDTRENPLVDLPFSDAETLTKLNDINAVFVSHLHPDHWDEAAVKLIDKSLPIICPSPISEAISAYGFLNVQPIYKKLQFNDLEFYLTSGQHGTDEIGEKMGLVNGVVIKSQNQKVYVAGDTIWCQEVKDAIDSYKPQHIIVAGGAATFSIGNPVTMTTEHILELATYAPNSTLWITHLEAISPCTQDRTYISEFLENNRLTERCKILADGQNANLFSP
jgi:L-ascorbate metabolism protein UlaG (beta-lactamase superfamily)